MSLKAIARHRAAVDAGTVEKTNVLGICKAINSMERGNWPAAMIDAQFELEHAIAERRPVVVGELHETGLKVLRNPRYAKRWTPKQRKIIDSACKFRLIRFDRVGWTGRYSVPVYQVSNGFHAFAFRNIPWQTAHYEGLDAGPCAVPDTKPLRDWAEAICRVQPGYGTHEYRGDPYEAVALQQEADRLECGQ